MVIIANKYYPVVDQPITEQLSPIPGTAGYELYMNIGNDPRGFDRYIYARQYPLAFLRYDTINNVWQPMATPPAGATNGKGSCTIFDPSRGTSGYIWSLCCGYLSNPYFSVYDVATNTWTAKSAVNLPYDFGSNYDAALCHPCTTYNAGGDDDAIFLVGSGAVTGYKYSILTDTWTVGGTPDLPATIGRGCGLLYIPMWNASKLVCFRGGDFTNVGARNMYAWDFKTPGANWDALTITTATSDMYGNDTSIVSQGVNSLNMVIQVNGTGKLYDCTLTSGANIATISPRSMMVGPAFVTAGRHHNLAFSWAPDGNQYIYCAAVGTYNFLRTQLLY